MVQSLSATISRYLDKESVKQQEKIKLGQMLARACKERKKIIYSKDDNDPYWILGMLTVQRQWNH